MKPREEGPTAGDGVGEREGEEGEALLFAPLGNRKEGKREENSRCRKVWI